MPIIEFSIAACIRLPSRKNIPMKREGFTLMEILVSVIILVLLIAGLLSSFISVKRFSKRSTYKMISAELIRYFFAPFSMEVKQNNWNLPANGLYAPTPQTHTYTQTIGLVTYTVTTVIDKYVTLPNPPYNMDIRRVTMDIVWNE